MYVPREHLESIVNVTVTALMKGHVTSQREFVELLAVRLDGKEGLVMKVMRLI